MLKWSQEKEILFRVKKHCSHITKNGKRIFDKFIDQYPTPILSEKKASQEKPFSFTGGKPNLEPTDCVTSLQLLSLSVELCFKRGLLIFHDLRHSTASYLVMNEVPLLETVVIFGHKTLQMKVIFLR